MTSEPMTPERRAEAAAYLAAQERELAELRRMHNPDASPTGEQGERS